MFDKVDSYELLSTDIVRALKGTQSDKQLDSLWRAQSEVCAQSWVLACERAGLHTDNGKPAKFTSPEFNEHLYAFHKAQVRFKVLLAEVDPNLTVQK